MYLNNEIAAAIIEELNPIVNFDINIIDTNGLIIASTDAARVNTSHEGARQLLAKGSSLLIIESDDIYSGARRGVNLPIRFSGRVIGVIGITGTPNEAVKHGRIVQKMTEMIVLENFNALQTSETVMRNLLLITNLINGTYVASSEIEERMMHAGLKPDGSFTAAVLSLREPESPANEVRSNDDRFTALHSRILGDYLIKRMTSGRMLCADIGDRYVAVTNLDARRFSNHIDHLIKSVRELYSTDVVCAIGGEYEEYSDIPKSYAEAMLLHEHIPPGDIGLFQYDVTMLDLMLQQIPSIHKRHLYQTVFKSCSEDEIEEFCSFIRMYFQCDGSLAEIAKRTYVHKNTVQYKIGKIVRKTSFDLRSHHNLFLLYIAAGFEQPSHQGLAR